MKYNNYFRIMALLLAVMMTLSVLSACGSTDDNTGKKEPDQTESRATENNTDTDTPAADENEKSVDLSGINAGDEIVFGEYEQDGNSGNGKEELEWIVLSVEGDKALLLSKYALESRMVNDEDADVTWETCTLRSWLNGYFLDTAFNDEENERIIETTLENPDNEKYGTDGGNDTVDKVFLLSAKDVINTGYGFSSEYDVPDELRRCKPTQYAIGQGAFPYSADQEGENGSSDYDGSCIWFLRTPGGRADGVVLVLYSGQVYVDGNSVVSYGFCIRPAIWVNIGE